jgi:hypothetical protein
MFRNSATVFGTGYLASSTGERGTDSHLRYLVLASLAFTTGDDRADRLIAKYLSFCSGVSEKLFDLSAVCSFESYIFGAFRSGQNREGALAIARRFLSEIVEQVYRTYQPNVVEE